MNTKITALIGAGLAAATLVVPVAGASAVTVPAPTQGDINAHVEVDVDGNHQVLIPIDKGTTSGSFHNGPNNINGAGDGYDITANSNIEGADGWVTYQDGQGGEQLSGQAKTQLVLNAAGLGGSAGQAALGALQSGRSGIYIYIRADVPYVGSSMARAAIVQVNPDGSITNQPDGSSTDHHIGGGSFPNADFTIDMGSID